MTDSNVTERRGFFKRLKDGLNRSAEKIGAVFTKRKLDAASLEELEELLIASDLGPSAAAKIVAGLARDRFDKDIEGGELRVLLAREIEKILKTAERPLNLDEARPHVVLVVGVNGVGKTTTIGKIARLLTLSGRRVVLAAGDTFRAAAIEQLKIWGERTGSAVVAREQGSDSAGLVFEALTRAKADGADILLVDTAGRLQNKAVLMDELKKIVRVIKKIEPAAPHDVLLVVDATTGQNAMAQAEIFREIAGVTGLVVTKLDGSARGGILVAIVEKLGLPVHFIGVGESADDLQPFDAAGFSRALAGLDA